MTGQAYAFLPYDVTGAHQTSPPAVEFGQFNATPYGQSHFCFSSHRLTDRRSPNDPTPSVDTHLYLPKNANDGFVPPTGYGSFIPSTKMQCINFRA